MQYLDAISKMTEWSPFVSKANHSISPVIQVYAPISNAEEVEVEWFYEDLQDLELTPKKISFSLWGTGMQKWEIKEQANLALEYRMKQGKG